MSADGTPGSAAGLEGEGGKVKKEKTFMEKNWLLLLCGGMLLFNMLNAGPPERPGAPPGGAAAPARRAVASR